MLADIGVASFKEFAVKSLVSYLRVHYGDKSANWYEEFWTGPRGKYCLCDAGYAGSNNNMGMEVDWRDIKKLVPPSASLGTFLGALWEFVRQLATEHRAFLESLGDPYNFPSVLPPGKPIWDRIQDMHAKTAVLSWVIDGTSKFVQEFPVLVHEIFRNGEPTTPLHLKIWLSHDVRKRSVTAMLVKIEAFKKVLMPAQHILKKLDPENKRSVTDVLADLQPLQDQYANLVVRNRPDLVPVDIKQALEIYKSFHLLEKSASWGDIPVRCTCLECFRDCVCAHTVLFTSLFDVTLRVPEEYIAATVGLRKKCRALKGAAGTKRKRLLAEIAGAKKRVESKIKFMKVPEGPKVPRDPSGSKSKEFVIPDADLPPSSEEEVPFFVAVHWCSATEYLFLQSGAPAKAALTSVPRRTPTIDNEEDFTQEVLPLRCTREFHADNMATAGGAEGQGEGEGQAQDQAGAKAQVGQPTLARQSRWCRWLVSRRTKKDTTRFITNGPAE